MKETNAKDLLQSELNDGLHFNVLLAKTIDFANGNISEEDFAQWGTTLSLRSSLPMDLKTAIITLIMNNYYYNNEDVTQEALIGKLYQDIFFYGYLLGYLDVRDINPDQINSKNYDLLEPIFGPWIESFAERDVKILKEMIFNSVQFYNSKYFTDALRTIDAQSLAANLEANKELLDNLDKNKDLIAELNSIATFTNPQMAELVEAIESNALLNK